MKKCGPAAAFLVAAFTTSVAAQPTLQEFIDATRGGHTVRVKQLTPTGIGEMGGGVLVPPRDEMGPLERIELMNRLAESRARLEAEGKLSRDHAKTITTFAWPLRAGAGRTDFDYHGISAFVDENAANPNQLLDYYCGARTYDLAGYNHQGTDIFAFPFAWKKVDDEDVVIVAGAPGTILSKSDGNYDRNCEMGSGTWNAVYVQHADGSVAWYGHMKSGSTTVKGVGETVVAGEYLGVVGSSGSSTGPHLHLELYDAGSNLVDPWLGECNAKSKQVTWAQQRAYFDTAVNAITVGTAAPLVPACPLPETSYAVDYVAPSTLAYFTVYLRDQTSADPVAVRWYRPDGTQWQSSNSGVPAAGTSYNAAYWYFSRTMPASPTGQWRFEATVAGQTFTKYFNVGGSPNYGSPTAIAIMAGDHQAVAPGTAFPVPLQAQVTDASGRPVPNAKVSFTVPVAGATAVLASRNALTDAGGWASMTAIANNATGLYNVSATVVGAPAPVFFLLNHANDPAGDADADGIPNGVEALEGRNPAARDNDVFSAGSTAARLFAMQQYRDFLNREGDSGGIAAWANYVNAGTFSRPQVIDAFFNSPEFNGVVAPVVRLYYATFLRVPDYAGLVANVGLIRNGTVTLQQVADFFTTSPEFAATYGSLDNTAFVTLLYNNVLGRAPDPGGLAAWVNLLGTGYTRGQVLLGFSDSPEYQAAKFNEVYVTMMYVGMLRRSPETGGYNGWVAYLQGGNSPLTMINGFFMSTEYHNRFLP